MKVTTMADLREGPLIFLRLSTCLDDPPSPPPLSEGVDPPLHEIIKALLRFSLGDAWRFLRVLNDCPAKFKSILHVLTSPPLHGSNCLLAEDSETSKIKKMEGEEGLKQMEVKKEKGRSQGAMKLFCPKTNFPF